MCVCDLIINAPVSLLQISAVRAVVPNKSNNEIVLVLQHFENCVDKAVQAFLEGTACLRLSPPSKSD